MGNYVDKNAVMHVLGNIYNNLELSNDERYPFYIDDFYDDFHKALYTTFYSLYNCGNKTISEIEILDYLSERPKLEGIFNANNGFEYIKAISESSNLSSFEYWYQRLKKFALLNAYDNNGINVREYYDPDNVTDTQKKQIQNDWIDNTSLDEMANTIEDKCIAIREKHIDNAMNDIVMASTGLEDLIEHLQEVPAYGYPLYGDYINTITRGARLGELYLRSGSSGSGKSRAFMADACCIGLSSYYDEKLNQWIDTNAPEPTLLISTEQQRSELQTMMLAFVSGVPEEHILLGQYTESEYDRILKANDIIQKGQLRFFNITNFGMNDILNIIKRSIRKEHIKYFFLDYLHTSINIISEMSSQTKGIALREDQILFMLADKLKQICLEEGVFIYTGTQLNGDYAKGVLDQNALRGSKAIADKISVGIITVRVTKEDLEHLQSVIQEQGCDIPKFKMSIYKNRGGKMNNIILWCEDRRDYSKINPLFATTTDYEYIDNLQDTKIKIADGEATNGTI